MKFLNKKLVVGFLGALVLNGSAIASNIIATVDGEKITKTDLNMLLRTMPGNIKFETLPNDVKSKFIDQAIERKLLMNFARSQGINKDPEFKKVLKETEDNLMLEFWMRKQFENLKVSDSKAKTFYKANKDKFKTEAQAKAKHILLKTEADAKSVIKELQTASKDKLKSKFIELAKSKSTGPSGANGGDLGWFGKKQMVPEFSKEAFGLDRGHFSQKPVKTQFGYHIVYLEDKKPAGTTSFNKVKEQIKQNMKMEEFKNVVSQQAKKLRSKAKVEIKK